MEISAFERQVKRTVNSCPQDGENFFNNSEIYVNNLYVPMSTTYK